MLKTAKQFFASCCQLQRTQGSMRQPLWILVKHFQHCSPSTYTFVLFSFWIHITLRNCS